MDFFGVFSFDFVHFLISLFVDLLHGLPVLLLESLNLLDDVLLPLLLILYLLLVIFLQLPEFLVIFVLVSDDLLLEELGLLLLGALELIVFGALLHDVLGLVGVVLLQAVLELFLLSSDLLIELLPH